MNLLRRLDWYSGVAMLVSVALVVSGFLIPPIGVVDGSVLTAVGELGGMASVFSFLSKLPRHIDGKARVSLQKGDTSVTIENPSSKL